MTCLLVYIRDCTVNVFVGESFNDTEFLLATGGFDNCVKIWRLCFAGSSSE